MALKDQLQQEQNEQPNQQNLNELLEETKTLNQLMTSYIRVHMNEDTAQDLTIESQLERIKTSSDQIIQDINSTLQKQSELLEKNKSDLQEVLTTGEERTKQANEQLIQKILEAQKTNKSYLQNMNEQMNSTLEEIRNSNSQLINDTKNEMRKEASKNRDNIFIDNWLVALKYGSVGAVLTSLLLVIFYFLIV